MLESGCASCEAIMALLLRHCWVVCHVWLCRGHRRPLFHLSRVTWIKWTMKRQPSAVSHWNQLTMIHYSFWCLCSTMQRTMTTRHTAFLWACDDHDRIPAVVTSTTMFVISILNWVLYGMSFSSLWSWTVNHWRLSVFGRSSTVLEQSARQRHISLFVVGFLAAAETHTVPPVIPRHYRVTFLNCNTHSGLAVALLLRPL